MTTKHNIGKKDFIFNDKPPQFDNFIEKTTNFIYIIRLFSAGNEFLIFSLYNRNSKKQLDFTTYFKPWC